MPNIVPSGSLNTATIPVQEREYQYPMGMDLRPGTKLHEDIVQKIMQFARDSHAVMQSRHSTWNDVDKTLKIYVPLSEAEKTRKSNDRRQPVSIVVPYSYATLETIMAYMTEAFLTDSVFSYEGSGPEDVVNAKLMELAVNQQVNRFKSVLEMYIAIKDGLSYGFGASTLNWTQVWGKKPTIREIPQWGLYGNQLPPQRVKENVDALLFEGNEIIPIDPYRFLPDPSCSIHNIQAMEYVGWTEQVSFYTLLGEESGEGPFFNVKYLNDAPFNTKRSIFYTDYSKRIFNRGDAHTTQGRQCTKINMYVTLIPREWGLKPAMEGNRDGYYPEKWLFVIVDDTVLVRAQPLGMNHGKYPLATVAPDFDGYSITPLSRLELVNGLQTTLDWLFNSHIANVRKAINDMLIVDPSLVNMADLENPEPGKLVRLRRSAWGRGVNDAVQQLTVNDITARNMSDAEIVMSMMSRASASTDAVQGIVRQGGERVSASEYNGTIRMAVSRLARLAKMVSKQYLHDLGYMHASHTQQFMSEDTYVKVVGDWPLELMQEFGEKYGKATQVTPFDMICDYDVVFKDANTNNADAISNDFWTKTLQIIATSPALAQEFDIARIFIHMARLNGVKNAGEFKRQVSMQANTLPDEQVMDSAQRGNVVSMEEFMQNFGRTNGEVS